MPPDDESLSTASTASGGGRLERAASVRRRLTTVVRGLIGCLTVAIWLWAVGAVYFIDSLPAWLAVGLAGGLLVGPIVAAVRFARYRVIGRCLLAVAAGVAIALSSVQPANDRDWAPDQAVLPSGEVADAKVSLANIRQVILDPATGEIAEVRYFDRAYRLDQLQRVWFGVEYFARWTGLAHTFVTFEFAGAEGPQFLTISIEIRREKGESFDPLAGLYRRYELMYVVSDERDMIENRLATTQDRFVLYPIRATPEARAALLANMIERINALQARPEFYNTFTNNCTNNIVRHLNRVSPQRVNPYSPKIVFPGYSDRVAYKLGLIDTELSFAEAREKYRIDVRGRDLVGRADFSTAIRQFAERL